MSAKVMASVWEHSQHTGTELLVLLAIADHANDEGQCWPHITRLAARARVTPRQVTRIVHKLEAAGSIEVRRGVGRGHPSLYLVKDVPGVTFARRKPDTYGTIQSENLTPMAPFHEENLTPMAPFHEENLTPMAPFHASVTEEKVTSRAKKGDIQGFSRVRKNQTGAKKEEPSRTIRKTQDKKEAIDDEGDGIVSAAAFVQCYNQETPEGIPKVQTLSDARRKKIQTYLRQFPHRAFWLTCFHAPATSAFLRGERSSPGHEHFRFTLDWLLTKGKDGIENCVKVSEGRYTDPPAPSATDPAAEYNRYLTPEGYWEYPGHPIKDGEHYFGRRTGTGEMYCIPCQQNLGVYAPQRKES